VKKEKIVPKASVRRCFTKRDRLNDGEEDPNMNYRARTTEQDIAELARTASPEALTAALRALLRKSWSWYDFIVDSRDLTRR